MRWIYECTRLLNALLCACVTATMADRTPRHLSLRLPADLPDATSPHLTSRCKCRVKFAPNLISWRLRCCQASSPCNAECLVLVRGRSSCLSQVLLRIGEKKTPLRIAGIFCCRVNELACHLLLFRKAPLTIHGRRFICDYGYSRRP